MRVAPLPCLLGALLAACGSRTDVDRRIFVDGTEAGQSGAGGAAEGNGGTSGVILPPGRAPIRPLGTGGAPRGAGGAAIAGGRAGVGGAMVSTGGVPVGAGGYLPATGGVVGFGGAGGKNASGGAGGTATGGTGGAPLTDAGPDAEPNYCDPAVQCATPFAVICRGVIDCGHGQDIQCSKYVTCTGGEVCDGLPDYGHCTPCEYAYDKSGCPK